MSRALHKRMNRIEAARHIAEYLIVPPTGLDPTPERIAALRNDILRVRANPKGSVVIYTMDPDGALDPRLTDWGVADLFSGPTRDIEIRWAKLIAQDFDAATPRA